MRCEAKVACAKKIPLVRFSAQKKKSAEHMLSVILCTYMHIIYIMYNNMIYICSMYT